jgi:transposase InsO family protein
MAAGFAFVYAGHHSRQQVSERRPAPTKANPHTTFFRDRIPVSNNLNPRPLILRNFNAVSESFFASLKKELVYQQEYSTREEARQSIFQWIETFYNRTRLHSYLGYVSPEQFEQQS